MSVQENNANILTGRGQAQSHGQTQSHGQAQSHDQAHSPGQDQSGSTSMAAKC